MRPALTDQRLRGLLELPTAGAMLRVALSADHRRLPAESVRVERCWPGRNGEFHFEWSFNVGRQRRRLFGTAPVDAVPTHCDRRQRYAAPAEGICCHLPEWRLLIHSPDCDPDLPHLARCLQPAEMATHLAPYWRMLTRSRLAVSRRPGCELLGYRAGRRATLLYCLNPRGAGPHLVGKTFRDERGGDLLVLYRDIAEQLRESTRGQVRVPAPVGFVADLGMVVFQRVPGEPATPGSGERHLQFALQGLTALHATEPAGRLEFSVADELSILARWQATLDVLAPLSATITQPLYRRLCGAASQVPPPTYRATIHRDFYDRQIAVHGSVYLLDLDTLARGDPAVDIGNLLAHVALARVGEGRALTFQSLRDELTRGYESRAKPLNGRALAFFSATALFRVGAVHTLRSATRCHAPALWRLAEAALGELNRVETRHTRVRRRTRKLELLNRRGCA